MPLRKLTVKEIQEILRTSLEVEEEFLSLIARDRRRGVRQAYQQWLKNREKYQAELQRSQLMKEEELKICSGVELVAGVDEAGRGPLAGPVVAAAVILPPDCIIPGIDDSKKIHPARREELAAVIKEKAISWAIGIADVDYIDSSNILQATLKAMREAVTKLFPEPKHVLVDAINIPGIPIEQTPVVDGDARCYSIAAASILAKVERDKIMDHYHHLYPQYGFDRHKGYGTREHLEALARYGPCPIHRCSFTNVKEILHRRGRMN